MIPFEEKTKEKQNSAIIMISVDWKGTLFPMRLKLQGQSFKKYIWKKI